MKDKRQSKGPDEITPAAPTEGTPAGPRAATVVAPAETLDGLPTDGLGRVLCPWGCRGLGFYHRSNLDGHLEATHGGKLPTPADLEAMRARVAANVVVPPAERAQ